MLSSQLSCGDEPTREDLRQEASNLEVFFDECSQGELWLRKGDLCFFGSQDTLAGRLAAWGWLEQLRRLIEARDQLRSLDPLPRRRMLLQLLWRH